MRTSATLLSLIAAATLSASAFAAPTITPDAGSPAMAAVQTIQGSNHKVRPAEAAGVTGVYDLSDGQILRVSFEQRKLFAEVGERKSEIVPAGQNAFVSRNGDMKLVFDQLPFATGVALTRN
jgi:hypothetical protein